VGVKTGLRECFAKSKEREEGWGAKLLEMIG
jgi:hypothetical protein